MGEVRRGRTSPGGALSTKAERAAVLDMVPLWLFTGIR